MNWMIREILIAFLSGIFLSTVLGSVLFGCWRIFSPVLERHGFVRMNYGLLKLVLVSFLVPFSLIFLVFFYMDGVLFSSSPIMAKVSYTVSILWLFGVIMGCVRYVRLRCGIRKIICDASTVNNKLQKQMEEEKERLKILRKIRIKKSERIQIPIVCGVIRPIILFPANVELSNQEQKVALLHELIHIKHGDLFWKQLCNIAAIVHWFHPVMKGYINYVDQWSETYCDFSAYQTIQSKKTYFQVIFQIATKNTEVDTCLCNALYENRNHLEQRILRSKAIGKMNRVKGILCAGISLGILAIGTITVGAATMGYRELYLEIVDVTCEEHEVKGEDNPDTAKEYERKADKSIETEKIKYEKALDRTYAIPEHNIHSKIQYEFKKIKAKKGEFIWIIFCYNTKKEKRIEEGDVLAGIIDEKGNQRYIKSVSRPSYHFEIKEKGEYTVFVRNVSGYTIEMAGTVALLNKEDLEK
ncbi:MAG: M56 family metallopeptidase [Anaerostipes sp.]|nr:M56 family metallopeptidase [Anaerostipes sp.]